MSTQKRLILTLAVAGLTISLAACGGSKTTSPSPKSAPTSNTTSTAVPSSIASNTTAPATTAAPVTGATANPLRVTGPGPFTFGQSGDPNTWPDACTLVNIGEIKALDPDITGLRGAPIGTKAQVLGGNGSSTPNNTECRFNLTTKQDPPDGYPPSYLVVQLQGTGPGAADSWTQEYTQAKSTAAKYPNQFIDFTNLPGSTKGFWDSTEVQALHGNYDFWIAGVRSIESGNNAQAQMVWAHQIEAPLAAKLGSELR